MGTMIRSILIASFFSLFLSSIYAQDNPIPTRKAPAADYEQECRNNFSIDNLTYVDMNYCDYPSLPKEEKEGLLKHFYCKAVLSGNQSLCDILGENERLTCRDYYGMHNFSVSYLLGLVMINSVTPEIVRSGMECKLFGSLEASRAFAQAFISGDASQCKNIKINNSDSNFCVALVSMDEGRTSNQLTRDFVLMLKAEKDSNKSYCERISNEYLKIGCLVSVDKNNPQVCKPDSGVSFTTLKNRKCTGFKKQ